MSDTPLPLFSDLNLSTAVLKVMKEVGYETPSPIQAATIPLLLANRDVLGQAQTGTGKTAAFALPILSNIDIKQQSPQALVLAPTRELAIQVAEAFQKYATHIKDFHVLPIYGGQSYGPQLSALRRGVHVVVGTPGRVIDHLEKGSLDLSKLKTLVLDEADEMLRMGFIDDVEQILQKTPASRQTALFSATMPAPIKRIAKTYLRDPQEVTVAAKTGTAENITQRYWLVSGMQKLEALTRILEAEPFDGMIIFARTKLGTEELATKLQARGFAATAINGDMQQTQRERTIEQLKQGKIDILVATDVAARGLDVERISHVINYDVPSDPESYTHRIGRTGRAGRNGLAISLVNHAEGMNVKRIERFTKQLIPVNVIEGFEPGRPVHGHHGDGHAGGKCFGPADQQGGIRGVVGEQVIERIHAGDGHQRRGDKADGGDRQGRTEKAVAQHVDEKMIRQLPFQHAVHAPAHRRRQRGRQQGVDAQRIPAAAPEGRVRQQNQYAGKGGAPEAEHQRQRRHAVQMKREPRLDACTDLPQRQQRHGGGQKQVQL